MATGRVEILGVRHHGPGSARAVVAALEELQPDIVLVEGPADADPLLAFIAADGVEPPAAILGYRVDDPSRAAFWPFAVFSPEWQAIRWAAERGVRVEFCDLPAQMSLADAAETPERAEPTGTAVTVRSDPIAVLARAAGQDDPERWWEDVVESGTGGPSIFTAVTEAMAMLRAERDEVTRHAAEQTGDSPQGAGSTPSAPDAGPEAVAHPVKADQTPSDLLVEQRREAFMRQCIRSAQKSGAERVAVVCGAWHAPALAAPLGPAAADARILRGMPKSKVALTWVPWTHSRLASASGYGAGIESPGWYHHLFTVRESTVPHWLTLVARELRTADLPVSSAHVIEAVRLATTLATMRGRPLAGLTEVTEATQAVMCDGDPLALDLVTRRLVVGETMGSVTDDVPAVALEVDLAATVRRLRLKREPGIRTVDLDLRKENDLARSRLLHRLRILEVGWGAVVRGARRSTGTFRETWELAWAPEVALDVVLASLWGSTVATACSARITDMAAGADDLATLTSALEDALLADVADALPALLDAVRDHAALDPDCGQLMAALPALVRTARYGDVRGTDVGSLTRVIDAITVRICVGLPAAASNLDDDAARSLVAAVDHIHESVLLLDAPAVRSRWLDALQALVGRATVAPAIAGRAVRLLRDTSTITAAQASATMALALSHGADDAGKAAWVSGFLGTSGDLLVHDESLLTLLDGWLVSLDRAAFVELLPLLRRSFGAFHEPVRRSLGNAVAHRHPSSARTPSEQADGWGIDAERGARAVRTVAHLLGLERTGS